MTAFPATLRGGLASYERKAALARLRRWSSYHTGWRLQVIAWLGKRTSARAG
jgi:hypothetical protein